MSGVGGGVVVVVYLPPGHTHPWTYPTPGRNLAPDIPTAWRGPGTRDIPVNRTHGCENMTFPQLRLTSGKKADNGISIYL